VKRIGALALLLLSLTVAGCASSSDGGPVGSGISASMVSGNIVAIGSPSPSRYQGQNAGATLEPVLVSIDEAPTVIGETDADGNFLLSGAFSGQVTVRFSTAEFSAVLPLNVPLGSVVVLQDVVIRPSSVQIGSALQLSFSGTVAATDCDSKVLVVNDRKPTPDDFLVWLSVDTSIIDASGEALACATLQEGQSLCVQGAINVSSSWTTALAIEVEPSAQCTPKQFEEIRVLGTIHIVNCGSGMISLDGPTGTSRVLLSPSTVLEGATDQQPLTCQDLSVGDTLDGQGLINIRNPGVIDAETLTVHRSGAQ
jgi:hypothetical protein